MTIEIYNLIGGKCQDRPTSLYTTVDFKLEGLRTKEVLMAEKTTWISTLHGIDNASWCTGFCVKPTSTPGDHDTLKSQP